MMPIRSAWTDAVAQERWTSHWPMKSASIWRPYRDSLAPFLGVGYLERSHVNSPRESNHEYATLHAIGLRS
jgi:hypothetical protein